MSSAQGASKHKVEIVAREEAANGEHLPDSETEEDDDVEDEDGDNAADDAAEVCSPLMPCDESPGP